MSAAGVDAKERAAVDKMKQVEIRGPDAFVVR